VHGLHYKVNGCPDKELMLSAWNIEGYPVGLFHSIQKGYPSRSRGHGGGKYTSGDSMGSITVERAAGADAEEFGVLFENMNAYVRLDWRGNSSQ
jgi:hypothetical protein